MNETQLGIVVCGYSLDFIGRGGRHLPKSESEFEEVCVCDLLGRRIYICCMQGVESKMGVVEGEEGR